MTRSKSSGSTKQRSSASVRKKRSGRSSSRSRRSCPSPVLGLDLSLTATGLVVWDGEKILRKRRYKTAPMPQSDGLRVPPHGQRAQDRFLGEDEERINWLKKKILLAVRKYGICFCVIEGHAFGAQGRGKTVLAELAGVVKDALYEEQVAYVTRTPQQIKKHVTGNGKAEKIDVIYAAKAAGQDISDSDTADAWAAAKLGWDEYDSLTSE